MKSLPFALGSTLALLAAAPTGTAQCPVDYVTASDGAPHSLFGDRLAVSGEYAVVGAKLDDEMGTDAGAAYAFELVDGAFVEVRKFLPPTNEYGQNFGRAVAIDGDRLLVGSRDNQAAFGAGAGFVYRRTGGVWQLEDTLFAIVPQQAENLGVSAALEGERAALGALPSNLDVGHVIVFERGANGWGEVARLQPVGPETVRGFGTHVAMSGERILVHAVYSDGGAAAYVFDRGPGGWAQTARLQGQGAENANGHSNGLALEGDVAVYAVPHENPGAAYVFERIGGAWKETKKLLGSGDPMFDFGSAADVRGGRIAVGGIDLSFFGVAEDYVEVFRRAGGDWVSETVLTRVEGSSNRGFGADVALWRDSILVGSPDDFALGSNAGAVHVYNLAHETTELCAALPNSTGAPAVTRLDCGGKVTTLALRAGPVPNTLGLFYSGQSSAKIPAWNGLRCISGKLVRMPAAQAAGNTLAYDLDLVAPAGKQPWIQPGSTWHFQGWFREPVGAGANFSSALTVTFAP